MSRKNRKPQVGNAAAPTAPAKPFGPGRRVWLILLACLAGAAVVSFILFRFVFPPVPADLVGNWQVTEGPLRGATLEIHANGTAVASVDKQGKKLVSRSTVKVEENRLFLTTQDSKTGEQETVVQTILNLSDNELVIRDEDKLVYRMRRKP